MSLQPGKKLLILSGSDRNFSDAILSVTKSTNSSPLEPTGTVL